MWRAAMTIWTRCTMIPMIVIAPENTKVPAAGIIYEQAVIYEQTVVYAGIKHGQAVMYEQARVWVVYVGRGSYMWRFVVSWTSGTIMPTENTNVSI